MGTPYIGEIRMFGGNFAPAGWMFCDGSLLPISENEALFTLIGTTYGGDGIATFALPDLRGRLPLHMGTGPSGITYQPGAAAGVESVTLTTNQIPNHTHALVASQDGANQVTPQNHLLGTQTVVDLYRVEDAPAAALHANALAQTGGSQPHSNLMPYLCVSFIISLFGIFPQP